MAAPTLVLCLAVVLIPLYTIKRQDEWFIRNMTERLAAGQLEHIDAAEIERIQKIHGGAMARIGFFGRALSELDAAFQRRVEAALREPAPPNRRRLEKLETYQALARAAPSLGGEAQWRDKWLDALADELAFVRSWQEPNIEIRIADDFPSRLAALRKVMATHPFIVRDPSAPETDDAAAHYGFRSRRYLSGLIAESLMEMAANPETAAVLTASLPKGFPVDGPERALIPLSLLHDRVSEMGVTAAGYRDILGKLRDGLGLLEQQARARSFQLEKLFESLLAGLPEDDRKRVSRHVIGVVGDHYLFDRSSQAMPEKIIPLPSALENDLSRPSGGVMAAIRRLCGEAVYKVELESLAGAIAARCYEAAVIQTLADLMTGMLANDWRRLDPEIIDLLQIEAKRIIPRDAPHLRRWRQVILSLASDMEWIGPLVKRWKYLADETERLLVLSRVKEYGVKLCRGAGPPHGGPCAVFLPPPFPY